MPDLKAYREEITEDIAATMDNADFQPALLVGSGLSIRYFSGPGWDELLKTMTRDCPTLGHDYGYYRQIRTPQEMGQFLAEQYAMWAWNEKDPEFSESSLDYDLPEDTYIVCVYPDATSGTA